MAWSPIRIAHRGDHRQAPENTRIAFNRAVAQGAGAIELDVQLSKDGVPVVYHDPTLIRICGSRRRIRSLTVAELNCLDWGAWFSPKFARTPLLTLLETLDGFAGRLTLMVEIKSRPHDRIEMLTRQVITLIDQHVRPKDRRRVQLLSFDPQVLAWAHEQAPDLAVVLNVPTVPGPLNRVPHAWRILEQTRLPWHAICVQERMLVAKTIEWMRDHAPRVYCYSCNQPHQVNRARRFAVDGVMTDRLQWLNAYIESLSE